MIWKAKRSGKEKLAESAVVIAMVPLWMWVAGIAVQGITGNNPTRGESLAIVVMLEFLSGKIARDIRYYLTDI